MVILEFLESWINIIYALFLWVVVFLLIKPYRIKELLPIGILGAFLLFSVQLTLISLNLLKFNNGVFYIYGIPLFNPVWGAAAAILVMNYMKQNFLWKIPTLLLFTAIATTTTYFALDVGNISFLGKYNIFYDAVLNFFVLLILTHISEGLFGKTLYNKKLP